MPAKMLTSPDRVPNKPRSGRDSGSNLQNHQAAFQPRDLMARTSLNGFNCLGSRPGKMLQQCTQNPGESGRMLQNEPFELVEVVSRLKPFDLVGDVRGEDGSLSKGGGAQNDDCSGQDGNGQKDNHEETAFYEKIEGALNDRGKQKFHLV